MHCTNASHLTETTGAVDRFLLDVHGDAWVLLLTDGTEVRFPPHLSTQVAAAAVEPGGAVTVHGVRPRAADRLAAALLVTDDSARIIARQGQRSTPLFRRQG